MTIHCNTISEFSRQSATILILLFIFAVSTRAAVGEIVYDSAGIYMKQGQYDKALDKYLNYVSAAKNNPDADKIKLMQAYMRIGSINNMFEDFTQAIDYYEKALMLSRETNNGIQEFELHNNMIGIYCEKGDYIEAEKLNRMIEQTSGLPNGLAKGYYVFKKDI